MHWHWPYFCDLLWDTSVPPLMLPCTNIFNTPYVTLYKHVTSAPDDCLSGPAECGGGSNTGWICRPNLTAFPHRWPSSPPTPFSITPISSHPLSFRSLSIVIISINHSKPFFPHPYFYISCCLLPTYCLLHVVPSLCPHRCFVSCRQRIRGEFVFLWSHR